MLTLQKYSENRPCRVFAPLLVSLLLLLPVVATAQTDFDQKSIGIVDTVAMKSSPAKSGVEYTDIFLDTVNVKKAFVINDYSLFGVEYGVSLNGTSFNPSRNSKMVLDPTYFGVTWTKYGKLFGYMPYFGLQVGAFYGHEGYEFKMNKETGIIPTLDDNAVKVTMNVFEVPALAVFHFDTPHFKIMGLGGFYAGYRLSIEREGDAVPDDLRTSFRDTDIRMDYGWKVGAGFGLVFDPFEIHVKGMLKYAWSSLYQPDYYSEYYYRFAYPISVQISAGLFLQLGRRTGKTTTQLRREARDMVYNPVKEEGNE